MAYKFDQSVNARYCPMFDWVTERFIFPNTFELQLPRDEHAPYDGRKLIIKLTSSHKTLPDIFQSIAGKMAVSEKMKRVIEKLEPNIHQFVPFEAQRKSGEPFEGTYYFMKISQFIDAIIYEKSNIIPFTPLVGIKLITYGRGPVQLTLKKSKIDGKHLWEGDGQLITSKFCSDEFFEIFKKEKLKQLSFDHLDEE